VTSNKGSNDNNTLYIFNCHLFRLQTLSNEMFYLYSTFITAFLSPVRKQNPLFPQSLQWLQFQFWHPESETKKQHYRLWTDWLTDRWTNQTTNQPASCNKGPSWKVKGPSATQEIPCISQNTKVHYHVHNSPSLVPILSHVNPFKANPSYFFKIHFNIIPPPMTVLLYVSPSKPCL